MQRERVDPHVGQGASDAHGSTVKCRVWQVPHQAVTRGLPSVSIMCGFAASYSASVRGAGIGWVIVMRIGSPIGGGGRSGRSCAG